MSNLVMSAHVAGIKSIKHLNEVVIEFHKIAKETFLNLVEHSKGDVFTTAGLIRLALVYVTEKQTSVQILRLVPFNGKLNKDLCKILHPEVEFKDVSDLDFSIIIPKILASSQISRSSFAAFQSAIIDATTKPKSKPKRRPKKS